MWFGQGPGQHEADEVVEEEEGETAGKSSSRATFWARARTRASESVDETGGDGAKKRPPSVQRRQQLIGRTT